MMRRIGTLWMCAWLVLSACRAEDDTPTQVMLLLNAEVDAAPLIRSVVLTVEGRASYSEGAGSKETSRFTVAMGDWPIEVALLPKDNDAGRRYSIEAVAFDDGEQPLSVLRAEGGYRKGVLSMVTLSFDLACVRRAELCPDSQTCSEGTCRAPDVFFPVADGVPDGGAGGTGGHFTGGAEGPGTGGASMTGGVPITGGEVATGGATGAMDGGARDADMADADMDDATTPGQSPCELNNGGCPEAQRCVVQNDGPLCLTCPADSTAPDGTCGPQLTGLSLAKGLLSPAFTPEHTRYSVQLPLLTHRLTVTATAPLGSTMTLAGADIPSSQPWSSARLPYGPTALELTVEDAAGVTRTYTFEVSRRGRQVAYLKADNADVDDTFGRSVAISDSRLVVGAVLEDGPSNARQDSGAVYMFEYNTSGDVQQSDILRASDPRTSALFGSAVALEGDTLLVGAVGGESAISGMGAAYVFEREGQRYQQQARLVPRDSAVFDWFGVTVALAGDTAFVAAPDQAQSAVSVFERSGSSWSLRQTIAQSASRAKTRLGASMAVSGNLLVVGAPEQADGVSESGAALVYERGSNGDYSLRAQLLASDPGEQDWFGYAVAVQGDTVVVGAPQADRRGTRADGATVTVPDVGKAYVFRWDGARYRPGETLEPQSGNYNARFGSALKLLPNGVLLVGAQGESDGGRGVLAAPPARRDSTINPQDAALPDEPSASGGVYVMGERGGRFVLDAYLKAHNAGAGDNFGYVLDATGDVVVVGALWESGDARQVGGNGDNDGRKNSGAAYLFQ